MTALFLLPLACAAACVTLTPVGRLVTSAPKVASFHAIDISSGFEATVVRGPTSVKIEADEALLPHVRARVDSEGVLHVGLEAGSYWSRRSSTVKVTISTPTLDGVEASGGSHVDAIATAAQRCTIGASGGSKVTVSSLACERLEVEASGGSQVSAVGHAKVVSLEASGGSHLGLRQVAADAVTVEASGGSEVRAFATAALRADLSGGTELFVAGHPASRTVEASGGARITDIP